MCLVSDIESGYFEKLQLIKLTETRLLIVISIRSGIVRTITLEIKSSISTIRLESVQALLNEGLSGLRFSEIRETFKDRFKDVDEKQKPVIRLFIDSVDKIFRDNNRSDKLIITGAKNVIKQPEFENPEKYEGIIELMEDKDIIIHVMEKSGGEKNNSVFISIGSENEDEILKDYSFISKEYKLGDTLGTLGIIGPKRMEYSKIVSIVDYIARVLSDFLKKPTT